jgi:hypothetical protein
MRETLLDKYIVTCAMNQERMPVYSHMALALQETSPVAHVWRDPEHCKLPAQPVEWPDGAFCLTSPGGITRGIYVCCVDIGLEGDDVDPWFNRTQWSLEGALVFSEDENHFDVVPLLLETERHTIVLAEVQLSFEFSNGKWNWGQAYRGPVNAMFHNVFTRGWIGEDKAAFEDAVIHLGSMLNLYLGGYHKHLQQPGDWEVHLPRAPKVKRNKKGEVTKIHRAGSVGYKEYRANARPEAETDNAQ